VSKTTISVNDLGYRVGQDHPRARLTDIEVDALIRDRGPEESPRMSYATLSRKYRISKSSVRDIITGRRRGCLSNHVEKEEIPGKTLPRERRVRVNLHLSLEARALLIRLGGGRWIEDLMVRMVGKSCAHHISATSLKVSIDAGSEGAS
jgi:hypothetical protein